MKYVLAFLVEGFQIFLSSHIQTIIVLYIELLQRWLFTGSDDRLIAVKPTNLSPVEG